MRRLGRLMLLGGAMWLLLGSHAMADARTDYLLRLLERSGSFRVRAQAALGLGRVDATDGVRRALEGALGDDHSAVRSAAAASLERLGDPQALAALRKARRDDDRSVRRAVRSAIRKLQRIERTRPRRARPDEGSSQPSGGPGRFYVGVGKPGSRAEGIGSQVLDEAREYLRKQLASIDGVVLAPDGEKRAQAQRVLKKRDLSGYYVDSSVVRVDDSGDGTKVTVSVILNTYPGRDMRAMLQGSATVPGGKGRRARKQALEGAFRGALRRLPQALEAAEAR